MVKPAKNTICLWYNGDAEDAARFYAKTFPDSSVGAVHLAPGDFPSGRKGEVLTVEFTVLGVPCLGLNGGPAFKHSEAFSFQVATADQAETDRHWNAIVGNGSQESACGWCTDRWGLSWRLSGQRHQCTHLPTPILSILQNWLVQLEETFCVCRNASPIRTIIFLFGKIFLRFEQLFFRFEKYFPDLENISRTRRNFFQLEKTFLRPEEDQRRSFQNCATGGWTMKGKILSATMVVMLAGSVAWGKDDIMSQAQAVFKPVPAKPPVLKGIPPTSSKIELGKMLFFDPRLSASNLISCNTCHNVGLGGVDIQETSVGHRWQKGPRNAPTVLNAVFNTAQFWDGRAKDLEAQAKGPVQASVEMNNKPERVVETLKSIPGYLPIFKKAFPREKDPISFDNMARAIEVFEATLITPDSRFDRYLKGDGKALTADEHEGLKLFLAKGCSACHNGVNMGGTGYFPFGVKEAPAADVRPAEDLGRFKVTNTAADKYVFKAPSLRNIALTPPYFHSGKVWKLGDAVKIMGSAQLGISLNDNEAGKIVAFLHALTGRQPRIVYPIMPPNSDATPQPMLR